VAGPPPSESPTPGDDDTLVPLGVVARPHGLGGELRVKPFNPETELLREPGRQVRLRAPGADDDAPADLREILSVREGPDVLLIRLEGVDDRDAADALRGVELCVRRGDFPALPDDDPDAIYLVDLVGLRVVADDAEADGDAATVGVVVEILDYPSVACLRVAGADLEWEVPNLERYVRRMDLDRGEVGVAHLEELPGCRRRRRPR